MRERIMGTTPMADADALVATVEHIVPDRYLEFRPHGVSRSTFYELRGGATWEPVYKPTEHRQGAGLAVNINVPVAPLAQAQSMDIVDEFTTNTIADYTFDAGAGTASTTGGQFVPSSTTEKRLYHSQRGYRYSDTQVQLKFTTVGSADRL